MAPKKEKNETNANKELNNLLEKNKFKMKDFKE